jgi:hypothetical protein
MKYLAIITLLWTSFQISGQEVSKSYLLGCWISSSEENAQGSNVSIYRPCDYKIFPPTRSRFKMNLRGGSKCSWSAIAPNDANYMQDGTWTLNEETNELKLYNLEGQEFTRFIIEKVEYNRLIIKN